VPDLKTARPEIEALPRLVRDIAEGRPLGDTTILGDATVVEAIRDDTGKAED
jgi:hypothetical protein